MASITTCQLVVYLFLVKLTPLVSSPLWGAGRVEDTYNLLGHALRKAVGVIARQQGGSDLRRPRRPAHRW
jgi:hypothetical protein